MPATKPRRRIKRRVKPVEEYDDLEDLDEGELEDLDEGDSDDPEVDESDEGEPDEPEVDEDPAPKSKRNRRRRARKVVDEDEDPEELDEPEVDEEPAPKPIKSKPQHRKQKPAVAPPAKDIEVRKVEEQVAEGMMIELLEAMGEGQTMLVTRVANKWQFSIADVSAYTGPKLTGKEFKDEVLSEEYKEWHADWVDLTYPEKKKYAKKLKAVWDQHEDERVDNIRMSASVRAKLNIEKYKPEYSEKSARDRLKG